MRRMANKKIAIDDVPEVVKDLAKQLEADMEDFEIKEDGDVYMVSFGNEEYLVFESSDDAEHYAVDRVKDDMENEPELFNKDFMRQHIFVSNTDARMIAVDEEEALRDSYDIGKLEETVEDLKDEVKQLEAEYKETKTDEAEEELESKKEELEEAKEELKEKEDEIDERVDEIEQAIKDDPYHYFVKETGMYTDEDFFKANFIQIDYDKASKEAVNVDGIAHFLAGYDGNEMELKNGGVAYRTN